MNNQERIIRWLLDAIDTEIAKPVGEADMVFVEECTALLGELNGNVLTLSKRELTKRCRTITRGKISVGGIVPQIHIRLVAALAACLAVFVVMSGCGYLPSITTILSTLFSSGVGKEVEIHEVTYTFEGMSKQYSDIDQLIASEELDILLPVVLPENIHITKILRDSEYNSIIVLFNEPTLSYRIYMDQEISDRIPISSYDEHINGDQVVYTKFVSNTLYIAYTEINDNIYFLQYYNLDTIMEILKNLE